MIAAEQLTELDHIVVTLTHLATIDGDHVVVQPEPCRYLVVANSTLGNLTLMVRELQIHTSTVDVKLITQVLGTHGGTLDVPAGETLAPRTLPTHDMLRGSMLPEGKICLVTFFFL